MASTPNTCADTVRQERFRRRRERERQQRTEETAEDSEQRLASVCYCSWLQSLAADCCHRNCICHACNAMQGSSHNAVHSSSYLLNTDVRTVRIWQVLCFVEFQMCIDCPYCVYIVFILRFIVFVLCLCQVEPVHTLYMFIMHVHMYVCTYMHSPHLKDCNATILSLTVAVCTVSHFLVLHFLTDSQMATVYGCHNQPWQT